MLVSNIDQLPGQVVRPKVEVELTSHYQSRKGHICNLTKYISRLSVLIGKTKPVSSIKKIEEKIEYTLFKINQLTEQTCLLKELEKAEILENLEEAENKLKSAKILDRLNSVEKSDNSSIEKHQINSRPKFDSNHKKNCSIKIHLQYYITRKKQILTQSVK